ncbi:response regulator [candidate division KSB1 bacterium]|nr:response regulator [candidate division KSB1 bacterium]
MIRILIVEDDCNTLTGLMELLSQEGYQTRGAYDGRQALQLFRDKPDDLVLCDYRLPDIDGLAVCEKIQQIQSTTKLIMMTAFSRAEIVNRAREIGILKVINKPISLEQLLAAIEAACSRMQKKNAMLL